MLRRLDTINPFDLAEALRAGLISEQEISEALCTTGGGLLEDLPVPAALTLIREYGGQRIWVATGKKPNNTIVRLLGTEAADILIARAGGDWMWVPKFHSLCRLACDRCIVQLHEAGKSVREIGMIIYRPLSLTDRQLWRTLARAEQIKAAWK